MSAAEDVRRQMGLATAALLDATDEQLAEMLLHAEEVSRELEDELRERGLTISQRTAVLCGIALSPIVRHLNET